MSSIRFYRRPVTDEFLRRTRDQIVGSDPLPLARFAGWRLAEEQGQMRCWEVREEVNGVDKGLVAVALFVVSEDGASATSEVGYLSPKYVGLWEQFRGWFDAELRNEGVLTVMVGAIPHSTEPQREPSGLPKRLRGGTRLTGVISLVICLLLSATVSASVRIESHDKEDRGHIHILRGNITKPDEVTGLINAPPTGTNITFTNGPYAFWVDAGMTRFDGNVGIGVTTGTAEALLEVQGAEATDSSVVLDADDGDDVADTWTLRSTASDNDLDFLNDTSVVGTLSSAGALTVASIDTGGGTALELAAGVWTASSNNIANLDSSSAAEGQYQRIGATVSGSVQLTVDPTAATTSTQLELDLPVSSDFGAVSDAAGSCGSSDIEDEVAGIKADATSNELEVLWITNSAASHTLHCSFSYQII